MPIRPENMARYPANWREISARIRERAGNRCECEGECGRGTHQGGLHIGANLRMLPAILNQKKHASFEP